MVHVHIPWVIFHGWMMGWYLGFAVKGSKTFQSSLYYIRAFLTGAMHSQLNTPYQHVYGSRVQTALAFVNTCILGTSLVKP